LEKRRLGKTGVDVTLLGLGGFHLVEVSDKDAESLVNRYLDAGGNYLETAASYGRGESERKIGRVMRTRRDECFLATKVADRDAAAAFTTFEQSLRNLQTDHVDVLFIHGVQTEDDLSRILGSGGVLEVAEAARQAGRARWIGVSGHGRPRVLRAIIEQYPFDVLMTGYNYYDQFNYPEVQADMLPRALDLGMGVVGMKALADGFLYRSPEAAIRYALSLPIHTLVVGANTMALLEFDLDLAEKFTPMSDAESETLYMTAPELGTYVCRQCGKCLPAPDNLNIPRIFELEGWYDRQMWDRVIRDPADYALRQRLRFWFAQQQEARDAYSQESIQVDPDGDYSEAAARCPYGLPVGERLQLAHYKLTEEPYAFQ
jgi:predicted aldo/keto reductase-like oxidoreductase